jgi:hypothetical protein
MCKGPEADKVWGVSEDQLDGSGRCSPEMKGREK